jgi:hypothetical protein
MYSDAGKLSTFVEQSDSEELKGWLLVGFESSDFSPLATDLEPSASVQLYYHFAQLPPRSKERFKEATIQAAAEWSYPAYSPDTLKQLILLAAYIKAAGITDVIRVLIESEALELLKSLETHDGTGGDAYAATVQYLVAVLQGFAPRLPKARAALERLFFSERFDPRFGAQLFVGLCECTPERYADYVPRFLDLSETSETRYSMPYVVHELVRIVSLPTLVEKFDELDSGLKNRFLTSVLLCEQTPLEYTDDLQWGADLRLHDVFSISRKNPAGDPSKPTPTFRLYLDTNLSGEEVRDLLSIREFMESPAGNTERPSQLYRNADEPSVGSISNYLESVDE